MTDRELLKLAAKAISLPGTWVEGFGYRVDCDEPYFWNPLTDDGEAIRLAMQLKIDIFMNETGAWSDASVGYYYYYSAPHKDDPQAATRRAIVRVAAYIGKERR